MMPSLRNVIKRTGLKYKKRSADQCIGTYSSRIPALPDQEFIQIVKPHQKLNKFPGSAPSYTNKTDIWLGLRELREKFGKKEFKFVPNSFLWPQEKEALQTAFQESPLWIFKPWKVRIKLL